MSGQDSEQNKSEEPTPYKLQRAREKGQVARSMEVGFLAALVALAAFATVAGDRVAATLAEAMRFALAAAPDRAGEPGAALALAAPLAGQAFAPVALLAAAAFALALLFELVQLRGFLFSAQALKPDFSRMNPAKGLKRLLSARMVKETLKSLAKALSYAVATWLVLRYGVEHFAAATLSGDRIAPAARAVGLRLLFGFIAIACAFVLIDQILVRRDYLRQMRMSRRELTREAREREGEPRLKQRRKALHAEFAAQGRTAGNLPGSDLLIVNPEHYAVALRYDARQMAAPQLTVKGRNRHALRLKDEAFRLGIPVVPRLALARALFRHGEAGREIPQSAFAEVADIYLDLFPRRAGDAQA